MNLVAALQSYEVAKIPVYPIPPSLETPDTGGDNVVSEKNDFKAFVALNEAAGGSLPEAATSDPVGYYLHEYGGHYFQAYDRARGDFHVIGRIAGLAVSRAAKDTLRADAFFVADPHYAARVVNRADREPFFEKAIAIGARAMLSRRVFSLFDGSSMVFRPSCTLDLPLESILPALTQRGPDHLNNAMLRALSDFAIAGPDGGLQIPLPGKVHQASEPKSADEIYDQRMHAPDTATGVISYRPIASVRTQVEDFFRDGSFVGHITRTASEEGNTKTIAISGYTPNQLLPLPEGFERDDHATQRVRFLKLLADTNAQCA